MQGRTNTGWGRRGGKADKEELTHQNCATVEPAVSQGSELPVVGVFQQALHVNLSAVGRFLLCRPVDLNACEEGPFQHWESMTVTREAERGKVGLRGWAKLWRT